MAVVPAELPPMTTHNAARADKGIPVDDMIMKMGERRRVVLVVNRENKRAYTQPTHHITSHDMT